MPCPVAPTGEVLGKRSRTCSRLGKCSTTLNDRKGSARVDVLQNTFLSNAHATVRASSPIPTVPSKLSTFAPRAEEGVCVGHHKAGFYYVLSQDGIIRTKHLCFSEEYFPIIEDEDAASDEETESSAEYVDLPMQHYRSEPRAGSVSDQEDGEGAPSHDNQSTSQNGFTYVPAQRSHHKEGSSHNLGSKTDS